MSKVLLKLLVLSCLLLLPLPARALTPIPAERACSLLTGPPAADCYAAIASSYIDRLAVASCSRLSGPAFVIACVRAIATKRYATAEVQDCDSLLSPWETVQCFAGSGRSATGGGCNSYGCWSDPRGGCNSYGCYINNGGCNSYGCWSGAGGGCSNYGCWHSATSGCNNYGCWRNSGGCNSYGCWHSSIGTCNSYGCSDFGECTARGCPK